MNKIKLLNPESMDLDSIIEWGKNIAIESSDTCQRAEDFYNLLKTHHTNMATLLSELQEKKNDATATKEDLEEIVETVKEVREAIHNLVDDRASDNTTLDIIEKELLATEEGKTAKIRLDSKKEHFRNTYFRHKARLGLTTQEDVANITHLDKRYISLIERGEHKPQFKTIKKIADAFGVGIEEFLN